MDKGFRKAPLAFCRKLCYADRGATSSTPVGGSPGFLGGYTSLPPIERKGAVRRTANLINDCQWQSHLAPHSCGASWRDKKGPPEGHPAQIFDKAFDKRRPAGVWQKSTGLPGLYRRGLKAGHPGGTPGGTRNIKEQTPSSRRLAAVHRTGRAVPQGGFPFIHIPNGMRLKGKGLSHGLKKSPPDSFLRQLRCRRPFESQLMYQKRGHPERMTSFLVRQKGLEPPTY